MAEFTQEQIDKMIADKVAEAKLGLFSEEDVVKRVTSESDRRVESGIQKGLETQKQKWEKEYSDKANLTADQLAKKDFETKLGDLTAREVAMMKRANNLEARDMLTEAQIPKSQYDKVINMLVSDDTDITKSQVQNFIDMFSENKTEIETRIRSEYSTVPKPNGGQGNADAITKESFKALPYSAKLKLKQTSPEIYKEFMK